MLGSSAPPWDVQINEYIASEFRDIIYPVDKTPKAIYVEHEITETKAGRAMHIIIRVGDGWPIKISTPHKEKFMVKDLKPYITLIAEEAYPALKEKHRHSRIEHKIRIFKKNKKFRRAVPDLCFIDDPHVL